MVKKTFSVLFLFILLSLPISANDEASVSEWSKILSDLNHIQNIAYDTNVFQYENGCSTLEEFKNDKGDILSHRFDCSGKKISVIYRGTFAIVFFEDEQSVNVIDLSTAKSEASIKKLVLHLLLTPKAGIGNPVAHAIEKKMFKKKLKGISLIGKGVNLGSSTHQWYKQQKGTNQPIEPFSMKEFSSKYRNANIANGEEVGKLAITFEDNQVKVKPRNTSSNRTKSFSFSFVPILGSYFSDFYLQVERGDMFQAGKVLKLVDDLVNSNPEELGFLKGHTREDRYKSSLLFNEIAKVAQVNPEELKKKLNNIQEKNSKGPLTDSDNFYREISKTDVAIKKRQLEDEQIKGKGIFKRMGHSLKKLVTGNDSRYTAGDIYEDWADRYSQEPLERINPILGFLSASNLFRNEAVHAGYLAENYFLQNQNQLYDKAIAMPRRGDMYLPDYNSAKASVLNAQNIFARNLCPSLEDRNLLSSDEQNKLREIEENIDEITNIFSSEKNNSGISQDYFKAERSLKTIPNRAKAMNHLASSVRKLELTASKILALNNELEQLSPKSSRYQAEYLKLLKLTQEWGYWNGKVREKIDQVMNSNSELAAKGKAPTVLPADLAYLYHQDPHSLDRSPGGPKESYLELNRWFTDGDNIENQLATSLAKGQITFTPPPSRDLEASYSPNYKVYNRSINNSNEMSLYYKSDYSVEQYHQSQMNAHQAYQEKKNSKKRFKLPFFRSR